MIPSQKMTPPFHAPGLMPRPNTIGITMREIIFQFDITYAELAKRMGVNRVHLSRILNDKRKLTDNVADRFSKVFGMPQPFLINLRNDYQKKEKV